MTATEQIMNDEVSNEMMSLGSHQRDMISDSHGQGKPIHQVTSDGETIEISPYIWAIMHGAPPRYLEDEEEAIRIAKALGWKPDPEDYAPPIELINDKEIEEVDRIMRARGLHPDEIDRILENGGGTLPGWNGTAKTNRDGIIIRVFQLWLNRSQT